jgi:diguanylate cyclase (GGDEF)-like protein/PAS domain S-box-containing protein
MSLTPSSTITGDASAAIDTTGIGPDALRHLLDAIPVMVALFDERRRVVFANKAYCDFAGRSGEAVFGRAAQDLNGEEVFRIPPPLFGRVLRGETIHVEGWVSRPDGGQAYMQRVMAPQRDEAGEVRGFFALLQDLTERRRYQDDLFRLAYYEPVTSLGNRQLLLKHLADYRAEGEPFTLIDVEIDRFQELRTSLGQAFADELLVDLAQRLQRDAGSIDLLARAGDHSFVLLLGGTRETAAVERQVETVAAIVRSARSQAGSPVFLSASIGVATSDPPRARPEDVLRDAEIAAARARESGGGRQAWFDPSMHARVVEQVSLEHDLRRALEREEDLWLAYQPIVEMVTGRMAGFEALARWNHPERGNLPPMVFVGIAESTGLVVSLGKWVLREACRQIVEWQELRPADSAPLFMSVNLSPRQLTDPDFLDGVRSILRETGCEPNWLKLEITESAVMEHTEHAIATLRALRGIGIKVSIDDFGTGYSSLSYLHRLPIDNLKIDRSFVSTMHNSEENRAIVRIIIDLARLLGFDVIAEGIETTADVNLLRALAVDFGQGFHFARPLPPAEAGALISADPPWRGR